MKFVSSAIIFSLSASAAALSIIQRQDGPVDPTTDPDCDWYDTAIDKTTNCAYFEDFWGISHLDFTAWVCIFSNLLSRQAKIS